MHRAHDAYSLNPPPGNHGTPTWSETSKAKIDAGNRYAARPA